MTTKSSLSFRPARIDDFSKLKRLGVPIIREEYSLVVEKKYGQFFFAQLGDKTVGLVEILYRCFDDDVEEHLLQPKLRLIRERGENYTHDDFKFIEGEQVYISWIAVLPKYQNQGLGAKICRFILNTIPPTLEKVAVARVNNLPSIRLLMRELKMSIIGTKPINRRIIGSRETNFVLSSLISPILNPSTIKNATIFHQNIKIMEEEELLIPVENGEEEDLEKTPELKTQLQEIFRRKFVIRGLFKAEELEINEKCSFFYCQRNYPGTEH